MRNLNEANPPLDPLNWDIDLNSLSGEFGAHKKGGEMRARPKNTKKKNLLAGCFVVVHVHDDSLAQVWKIRRINENFGYFFDLNCSNLLLFGGFTLFEWTNAF